MEAPLAAYTPDIVRTRNETQFNIRRPRPERAKVSTCGWFSDPKEPYKPLGKLELNTETLLYKNLNIAIPKKEHNNNEPESEEDEVSVMETDKVERASIQNQSNGFDILKAKILKSRATLATVKFGSAFSSILVMDEEKSKEQRILQREEAQAQLKNRELDWNNLEIDTEGKAFYEKMLFDSAYLKGRKKAPNSEQTSAKATVEPNTLKPKEVCSAARKIKMEQALNIKNEMHAKSDSTKDFLNTRDRTIEQRYRLTNLLSEDLRRFECGRREAFQRKFKAFEVEKYSTSEGLKKMRAKSRKELKKLQQERVRNHPWYHEFLSRVEVAIGGTRESNS